MATSYDEWLPVAKKLVSGLAAKPGVRIVDKTITAEHVAQALHGMYKRGEFPDGLYKWHETPKSE